MVAERACGITPLLGYYVRGRPGVRRHSARAPSYGHPHSASRANDPGRGPGDPAGDPARRIHDLVVCVDRSPAGRSRPGRERPAGGRLSAEPHRRQGRLHPRRQDDLLRRLLRHGGRRAPAALEGPRRRLRADDRPRRPPAHYDERRHHDGEPERPAAELHGRGRDQVRRPGRLSVGLDADDQGRRRSAQAVHPDAGREPLRPPVRRRRGAGSQDYSRGLEAAHPAGLVAPERTPARVRERAAAHRRQPDYAAGSREARGAEPALWRRQRCRLPHGARRRVDAGHRQGDHGLGPLRLPRHPLRHRQRPDQARVGAGHQGHRERPRDQPGPQAAHRGAHRLDRQRRPQPRPVEAARRGREGRARVAVQRGPGPPDHGRARGHQADSIRTTRQPAGPRTGASSS